MKKIIPTILAVLCSAPMLMGQTGRDDIRQRLETHVYTLAADSMMGRKTGTPEALLAADYIISEFAGMGVEPFAPGGKFLQPFNADALIMKSKKTSNNVVGIIRGNDERYDNEYIIVGAHYDHIGFRNEDGKTEIFNGADDNASGVAVLIELARKLEQVKHSLRRSVILIAFDAEEIGLVGSRYYAENPTVPLDNIKLMMSIDMVGWLKGGSLKYYGAGTIRDGRQTVGNENLIPAGLKVEAMRFEGNIMTATDTEPFATRGVPTLHITTGKDSPYHKPEDTAEKIDYQGMTLIVENLANTVMYASSYEGLEASGQRSFKHRDYDKRFEGGLTLLVGMNSLRYDAGTYRGKVAPSFGAGLYGQFNMGHFGIRPELHFERNGAQYPDGRLWTNSLTVPLSFVIQSSKKYVGGFYLNVGGYYRYALSGKQGGEDMDFDNFYRNEAGAQWGFGVWLYRVSVGFNFRYGLTDLMRHPVSTPDMRNRSMHLNVSYRF